MLLTLIKKSIEMNIKIFNSIVCLLSMGLSYLYLFITLPLNSDTTGTYVIGNNPYTNLSYRSSIETGRWSKGILELIIEKLGYYNVIPFFLFLMLLLACAFFIYNLSDLFEYKNLLLNFMISVVFFITPAFVSLFTYFQDLYSHIFAILLSAMIIRFCYKEKIWIVYIPFLTIIVGLYQSYINLIVTIYIIYYINNLLNYNFNDKKFKQSLQEFIKFILLTFISIVLYYVLLKIFLNVFHLQSNMINRFKTDLSPFNLLHPFAKTYGMILTLPFKNYAGLNTTTLMKFVFAILFILSIISIVIYLKNNNFKKGLTLICLLIILPLSMNSIVIVTSHTVIRMTIGLGLIYLFFATMINYLIKSIRSKNIFMIINKFVNLLIIIIFVHMIYYANGFTYISKIVSDSTKSFTNNLVSNIKNVEGYNVNYKLYFYGTITNENLKDYYSYYDSDVFPIDVPYNLLLFPWEYKEAINRYAAFDYEEPTSIEKENIVKMDEFNEMDLYPNHNSIKIIDNILVVRFSY